MHFPTGFLKVVVLFRRRVHNSISHVSIGAFPEAANSSCLNVMSNQPKVPNYKPILDFEIR